VAVTPEESADERSAVRECLVDLLGDRTPGETQLVARLVSGFPAKARGLLRDAAQAAGRSDPVAATLPVHRLRGSAATLGSARLTGLCAGLEEQAFAGRTEPIVTARQELDDAVAAFDAVLSAVHRELIGASEECSASGDVVGHG